MKTILMLFTLILTGFYTLACDCEDTLSVKQAKQNADQVFTGQVISISPVYTKTSKKYFTHIIVELRVDTIFKGKEYKTIKIKTAASTAMCGFPFQQGDKYLVYSEKVEDNNVQILYADICDRTKILSEASYDIDELKRLQLK